MILDQPFGVQQAKPLGVVDFEAAELLSPLVEGGLTDAVPPAELGNGRASLMLFESLEDLFFAVSGFHG